MMVSPEYFVEMHKNDSYEDLIKVRKGLVKELKKFEKKGKDGLEEEKDYSSEIRYQANMDYLLELVSFMRDKYHKEYVKGGKVLYH